MIAEYWSTFKEILIILLGLAVNNAFLAVMKTSSMCSELPVLDAINLVILLLVMFRFGFGNIMLTDHISKEAIHQSKIYQLVTFVDFAASSFIMVAMSFNPTWRLNTNAMYVWFAALQIIDACWDLVCICLAVDTELHKKWLCNKVVWLAMFWSLWFYYREYPSDEQKPFFGLVVLITLATSVYSLYQGRQVYFPFLSKPATGLDHEATNPGRFQTK